MEARILQREEVWHKVSVFGPNYGRAISSHRQNGKGAGGEETLMSDAAMGTFMADCADNAALTVGSLHGLDASGLA